MRRWARSKPGSCQSRQEVETGDVSDKWQVINPGSLSLAGETVWVENRACVYAWRGITYCILHPTVFVGSLLIEHVQLHSRLFSFLSRQGRGEITGEPV